MLKIKDNVDLKELEKFGFEKNYSNGYVYSYYDNRNVCSGKITIEVYINREIYINAECYEDYDSEPNVELNTLAEKIIELFQAGLVEKVKG